MSDTLTFDDFDAFAALADDPSAMAPIASTNQIIVGEPIEFSTTIDGEDYAYSFQVESAKFTRLTQIVQKGNNDSPYNLATGVMNNVKASLIVHTDDEGDLSINNWLRKMTNANLPTDKQLDEARFNKVLSDGRFGYETNQMSLLFQHFGASQSKITRAFEDLIEAGGIDVLDRVAKKGNMRRVVFYEKGLNVESFELGSTDRTMSRTGQGFVDLLEAAWNNYRRVVTARVTARNLEVELDKTKDSMAGEDLAEMRTLISQIKRESGRWTRNWGGAQERLVLEDDELVGQGIWDQVSVPCGRLGTTQPILVALKENGEIKTDDTGNQIMVRGRQVVVDENDEPVRDAKGEITMAPASKTISFDLWKAQGDIGDNPELTASAVDTTVAEIVKAMVPPTPAEPESTEITDTDEF